MSVDGDWVGTCAPTGFAGTDPAVVGLALEMVLTDEAGAISGSASVVVDPPDVALDVAGDYAVAGERDGVMIALALSEGADPAVAFDGSISGDQLSGSLGLTPAAEATLWPCSLLR